MSTSGARRWLIGWEGACIYVVADNDDVGEGGVDDGDDEEKEEA